MQAQQVHNFMGVVGIIEERCWQSSSLQWERAAELPLRTFALAAAGVCNAQGGLEPADQDALQFIDVIVNACMQQGEHHEAMATVPAPRMSQCTGAMERVVMCELALRCSLRCLRKLTVFPM